MFALSNPKDEDLMHVCDHDHSDLCIECENVFQCLNNYDSYITGRTKDRMAKDELLYDLEVAATNIIEWMRHILRGAHTQDAKQEILEGMSDTTAFVIGDWMMKILPNIFGKR